MRTIVIRLITGISLIALLALSQTPQLPGKGWIPEFNHAAGQTLALAEATPAEKFTWRPAPGVRSVSEVYMHVAMANYFLLGQAGFKIPADVLAKLKPESEKTVTAKADVIQWLKDSDDQVRSSYPKADLQKKVKFWSGDTTVDG